MSKPPRKIIKRFTDAKSEESSKQTPPQHQIKTVKSLTMATAGAVPQTPGTYSPRMCRAVVDLGGDIMRDALCHKINPSTIVSSSTGCRLYVQQLTIISNAQSRGDYNECDITLLYTLLRNCTATNTALRPTNGWGRSPAPSDVTLGDDLERIRIMRNNVFANVATTSIPHNIYTNYMNELQDICNRMDTVHKGQLTRLSRTTWTYSQMLNDIQICCMDADMEAKYIDEIRRLNEEDQRRERDIQRVKEHLNERSTRSEETSKQTPPQHALKTNKSVIMATVGTLHQTPSTYGPRLCRAVVDLGGDIMRDALCHKINPSTIVSSSTGCRLNAQQLTIISNVQSRGDYNECDITLLYTLLRNCTATNTALRPTNGWGRSPAPYNVTLGDDLERIRMMRNEVFANVATTSIPHNIYTKYMNELQDICNRMDTVHKGQLTRLSRTTWTYSQMLNDIQICCMDADMEAKYIDEIRRLNEEDQRRERDIQRVTEYLNERSTRSEETSKQTPPQHALKTNKSVIMATAGTLPQTPSTYGPRMHRAVADLGGDIMRDALCHKINPSTIVSSSTGCRLNAQQLTIIINVQSRGDYNECDITLLYTLLRNCTATNTALRPTNGWGRSPAPSDVTLGDDLERIRLMWNEVYGHIATTSIPRNIYRNYMNELQDICHRMDTVHKSQLTRLSRRTWTYSQMLNDIQICCMDADMEGKYIEEIRRLNEEDQKRERDIQRVTERLNERSTRSGLPSEISQMDERSIQIFQEAINQGKYKSYSMRFMIVGHFGAGKTTLTKRLLGETVDITSYESTDGIELYDHHCSYNREEKKWIINKTSHDNTECCGLAEILQRHGIKNILKNSERRRNQNSLQEIFTDVSEVGSRTNKEEINQSSASNNDEYEQEQTENVEDESCSDMNSFNDEDINGELIHMIKQEDAITNEEEKYRSSPDDNDLEWTASFRDESSHGNKPLNDEEIKRRNLIQKIIQEDTIDQNTLDDIQIWDFGGQAALYCTHQGFLSHRAVYILVVDLSKDLQTEIEEDSLDIAKRRKCIVKEYITFWMNSVKFYTGGKEGFPRILLIGTHLNDMSNTAVASKLQGLLEEIRSCFPKEIESGQIFLNESFMLDLIEDDQSKYDKIRQEISDQAEKQPHWGEDLPMSWLPLQHYLNEERRKGWQILPIEQIKEYVESDRMTEAVDSREKLDVCLRFLHSTGNIIYYSRPGINTHLILNPKMLITTLRSLITCRQFCKSENRQEIHDRLANAGKVSQESIETIWKEKGFEELHKHKEYLIKIMQELDLLIVPKEYKGGEVVDGHAFYIPSVIETMPPTWTEEMADAENLTHCLFDFTKSFLPPAVIFRFIGSCISMWPAAATESLFFGGCYLEIDDWHRMLITTGHNQIRVTFVHWEDNKYLSRNTTNNVMDIMTEMLKSIVYLYPVKDGNTLDMFFSVDKRSVESLNTKENTHVNCVDCEGPTEDLLRKKPSVLQMMRFSKFWDGGKDGHRQFATFLEVEQCDQGTIEHDHHYSLPMKVFGYCLKWYDNTEKENSFSSLLEAAQNHSHTDEHIICKIMRDGSDRKQMRQIKREILEDPCSAEVIDRIPMYVGKEYYHFGLEMRLDRHELDEIVHANKESMAKIIATILKTATAKTKRGWLSIRKVACALLQVGCGFSDFKDLVNGKKENKCGRW